MEMIGLEPTTDDLQSHWSTNWSTSPKREHYALGCFVTIFTPNIPAVSRCVIAIAASLFTSHLRDSFSHDSANWSMKSISSAVFDFMISTFSFPEGLNDDPTRYWPRVWIGPSPSFFSSSGFAIVIWKNDKTIFLYNTKYPLESGFIWR